MTEHTIPMISIRTGCKLGLIHEINRRLLHPLGLAIVVEMSEDESQDDKIIGFLDHRGDPEGIVYPKVDILKAFSVRRMADKNHATRMAKYNFIVQPVSETEVAPEEDLAATLADQGFDSLDVIEGDLNEEVEFIEGGFIDRIIINRIDDFILAQYREAAGNDALQQKLAGIRDFFEDLKKNPLKHYPSKDTVHVD